MTTVPTIVAGAALLALMLYIASFYLYYRQGRLTKTTAIVGIGAYSCFALSIWGFLLTHDPIFIALFVLFLLVGWAATFKQFGERWKDVRRERGLR